MYKATVGFPVSVKYLLAIAMRRYNIIMNLKLVTQVTVGLNRPDHEGSWQLCVAIS